MITSTIDIQKTSRDWWVRTTIQVPSWPHPTVNNEGFKTLKSAIWHVVLDAVDHDEPIASLTVNGKIMPPGEVLTRARDALRGTGLEYRLDDLHKAFEKVD